VSTPRRWDVSINEVYLGAAEAFGGLVGEVAGPTWERPALGVWTVRELVGHTSAAISGVIKTLDQPAETESLESPEAYYAFGRTLDPAIYQAATDAVAASASRYADDLWPDPAAAVQELVQQVRHKLSGVRGDPIVQSAAGGMRLSAWLPTRTLELTVHSLDLAASLGASVDLPAAAVADAVEILARLAAAVGETQTVLRALTGRGNLTQGAMGQPKARPGESSGRSPSSCSASPPAREPGSKTWWSTSGHRAGESAKRSTGTPWRSRPRRARARSTSPRARPERRPIASTSASASSAATPTCSDTSFLDVGVGRSGSGRGHRGFLVTGRAPVSPSATAFAGDADRARNSKTGPSTSTPARPEPAPAGRHRRRPCASPVQMCASSVCGKGPEARR